MAGAYVQAQKVDSSGTSGGIVITLTAGSNVYVWVRAGATVTPSVADTLGNTYNPVARDGSNNWPLGPDVDGDTVGVYEALNVAGGATTITVSTGSSVTQRHIAVEVSGLTTATAVDKAAFTDNQATTTPTSGATASRTQADEFLLGFISSSVTTPVFTAGSGFTKALAETTKSAVEWQVVSATGTDAGTWTMGTPDTGVGGSVTLAAIATLKAATAASTSAPPAPMPRLIRYDRIAVRGNAKMEVFDSLRGQPFAALLPVDNTPQPSGARNAPVLPPQPKVMMLEPWRRGPFTGPQPARSIPAASDAVTGTVSVTDENDASAAQGIVTVTGSIAASEANDAPSASGAVTVTGTVAAAEANDTPSITGTLTVTGTIAATEANDTSAASGTVATPTGTLTVTEGDDTAAASGTITLTGSVAATEADDTSNAFGTVPSATAPRQEQPAWPYELKLPTLSGRKSWLNS